MGICSAPEVFHKTVHQFLEEFDGVTVYMDDIIVWGSTVEEHDERLMKALERLSEVGLVLNAEKCVFLVLYRHAAHSQTLPCLDPWDLCTIASAH